MNRDLAGEIKNRVDCRSLFRQHWPNHFRERGNSLCPFHEDHTPSLSVDRDHAYCHTEKKRWDAIALYAEAHGITNGEAIKALSREHGLDTGRDQSFQKRRGKIVATYDYTDESGEFVYQVVRIEPGPNGEKKTFRQRRPDGRGGWVWNLDGVKRTIYHLPEVIRAERVFIVEGEKDAEALRSWGLCATTCAEGAGKWRREFSEWFEGREVVILPDNDKPGRKHAREVAGYLSKSESVRIRLLELPGLPDKGDVSDWIAAGGTLESLLDMVEKTPEWVPGPRADSGGGNGTDGNGDAPHFRIERGEMHRHVSEALALMKKAGAVFQRGGELVRIGDGGIYPVVPEWLAVYLARLARFEKWDGRAEKHVACDVPPVLAKAVSVMNGEWGLQKLLAVVDAPVIDPATGRIIHKPGFDAESGIYLDSDEDWNFEGDPLDETACQKAVDDLWEPFRLFPFVDAGSRAGFFSCLLTAVCRPLLPTAPAFGISATTAGTGKTLLARCVGELSGGRTELLPPVEEEEEIRKRLFAVLRGGCKTVILDNLTRVVESASLCAVITTGDLSDRLLGSSSTLCIPASSMIMMTGNNLALAGDMARRVIKIQLDAGVERPDARAFRFDPFERVRQRRTDLVRSALALLRAYHETGALGTSGGSLGSFEVWSAFVRGCVLWIRDNGWLDVGDPADSIGANYMDDPETRKLGSLLGAWHALFGDSPMTVAQAIKGAGESKDADLATILDEIAGERGVINPRRLGRWIDRTAGRIVDNLKIENAGTIHRAIRWRVVRGCEFVSYCEYSPRYTENCQEKESDKFIGERGDNSPNAPNSHIRCGTCRSFEPSHVNPTGLGVCTDDDEDRLSVSPDDHGCPRHAPGKHT